MKPLLSDNVKRGNTRKRKPHGSDTVEGTRSLSTLDHRAMSLGIYDENFHKLSRKERSKLVTLAHRKAIAA